MADVFLSYKRDERDAVEKIAASLRSLRLSVWFDSNLNAGSSFSDEIEGELRTASAVLVCWSPTALASTWVKAEALTAVTENKFVSCQVAGTGPLSLPVPFNTLHAEDLREWLGKPTYGDSNWKAVLRSLGKLCHRSDIESWAALDSQSSAGELQDWIALHNASPLFMATHAMLRAREKKDAERTQAENAARAQRAEAERVRQEQKRRQEEEQLTREKSEKATRDREERKKRSFLRVAAGSLVAIPAFFVAYAVVGALAFVGMLLFQWLNADRMGGMTRMADLIAAGVSGFYGVQAGYASISFVAKIWNGWPTFLALIGAWAAALFALVTRTDFSVTWWLLVVGGLHSAIAIVAAYALVVRRS